MSTVIDTYGRDELLKAALGVDPDRFIKLFEQDPEANLTKVDNNGDTALHLAAMKGNIPIIEFLLKKGANTNAKDKFGATPLHLAAISGYTDSVKVLLEKK
jgi:ankyrin repeat protein